MKSKARSKFKIVKLAMLSLAFTSLSTFYTNCSIGGFGTASDSQSSNVTPGTTAQASWNISQISFSQGSGQTFDLSQTLPSCLSNNGAFSVDPTGTALPAGMSLNAKGILSVGSAAVADTTGVVFACTE